MNLKPFQQATVAHALEALSRRGGTRRFLVADEVGLGKTLVAQGVIDGLRARLGRHLNVFYVCSSLSIAHQNRESLLDLVPEDVREAARVEVDRLTLLPRRRPSRRAPFTLFTLTPGTLPLKSRAGRADERAVIWHLLGDALPGLRQHTTIKNHFQQNVDTGNWESQLAATEGQLKGANQQLLARFRANLGRALECAPGAWTATLIDALKARLAEDDKEAIRLCRVALSVASLEHLEPDLVILDEFQRFFEIFSGDEDLDPEAHELMRHLLGSQGQEEGAAVLMLSATPYRLYATWNEGTQGHYEQFYKLLEFLHGEQAAPVAKLKADFQEYQRRLKADPAGSQDVLTVRDRIQSALSQVMCRTERPAALTQERSMDVERRPAPLDAHDVRLFRHLRDSAPSEHRGMVPGFWASIPFPLQMMDERYKLRANANIAPLGPVGSSLELQSRRIRRYQSHPTPHPRLRALLEDIPGELLALPWMPPSRPWWALGGPFQDALTRTKGVPITKTLIFSHFRAVPRALASVLSYRAEHHCMAPEMQRKRSGQVVRYDYRARRGSDDQRKPRQGLVKQPASSFVFPASVKPEHAMRLLLMFFPMPELARLGNPLPWAAAEMGALTREGTVELVADQIAGALSLGVDRSKRAARPVWQWAAYLERHAATWANLREGWSAWSERQERATGGAARAARAFLSHDAAPPPPTRKELLLLARSALLAPGNVVLRATNRVFGGTAEFAQRLQHVLAVSMEGLRGYLDLPEFHVLLKTRKRDQHLAAVRRAIWDGNLESVLDEHLAYLQGLGVEEPAPAREARALEALQTALGSGAVSVRVHELGRPGRTFPMRCHAALPFGLTTTEIASEVTGKLRNDTLRTAFNSPFRPHVLATTSIGQEGLDFHAWCRHLVHWDLPGNPVDLEQREGRINRYAGLSVRQALAACAYPLPAAESPWRALAGAQMQTLEGLAPWWGCVGANIRRTVYVTPFSQNEISLDELIDARALYRLALGQVDQEQLVRTLRRRLESAGANRDELRAWLDTARIDLSPRASSVSKTSAQTHDGRSSGTIPIR